jgi:D-sedoheptulose 7-phosphate isomerase
MEFKFEIKAYLSKLNKTIDALPIESIEELMNVLVKAKNEERTIFIMGNGGSSATASHFVCDFNKGVSANKEKKFKFICLNDNIPSIMAYANDISFEDIFVEQLKSYFQKGDVVIGISGSGNSLNVIKAIDFASNNGGVTVGLTGYNGGKLKKIVSHNVNISIDDMQIVEDLHMVLDHCMMQILSNSRYEE